MELVGRMADIVSGLTGLPAGKVRRYRQHYQRLGYMLPVIDESQLPDDPAPPPPKPKVGSALKEIILGEFKIKTGAGCSCDDLCKEMDRNGPEWCEANRDYIISHLYKNRHMLTESPVWYAKYGAQWLPAMFTKAAAGWLLDEAIQVAVTAD